MDNIKSNRSVIVDKAFLFVVIGTIAFINLFLLEHVLRIKLLQPFWGLGLDHGEYLSSPLSPVILSVGFYFVSMIPWTIFDTAGKNWHWIQKYKIQSQKDVKWPHLYKAISLTLWSHILYILPISIAQWVWMSPTHLPPLAPDLWEFCWQQAAALVIFDFQFYVWHWTHHKVRWLYNHIHAIHHQYHSPNGWVTQYAHPWEILSTGLFTITSPWVFGAHPLTQWSFMLVSITVSIDDHTGYDLPFMPHHWLPFWGGSVKHDMHHQRPLTNYEPFFTWWDRMFGTECPGQEAGGYIPKQLVDWQKHHKAERKRKLEDLKKTAGKSEWFVDTSEMDEL